MALLCCRANSGVRLLKHLPPTGEIKVHLAFSGHKQEVIRNRGWGGWEIRQVGALASWRGHGNTCSWFLPAVYSPELGS